MFKTGFADNYVGQVRQTLVHLLALGLFLTISAFVSSKVYLLPGLLIGWTSSVIYFLLMCRRVKRSAELPPDKALASMRAGWVLRFGFMIAMLVVSVHMPGVDFWAAVVGLFSLHIVLLLNAVCFVVFELISKIGKTKN